MTEPAPTERHGRADLHIHTIASDGIADVASILDHVAARGDLDVIAITDHERIDAAVAAQAMARDRGVGIDVVVGEEVTTLGGHLLALWIDRPIRPYRSLRNTIKEVHAAGGLAIPAHPLVPYPLCAQGGSCGICSTTATKRSRSGRARDVQSDGAGPPVARSCRALRR